MQKTSIRETKHNNMIQLIKSNKPTQSANRH